MFYRLYPNGEVVHQDDFDAQDETRDDYKTIDIPDEVIAHIEAEAFQSAVTQVLLSASEHSG